MRDAVSQFDFCSYLAVAVFLFTAARQVGSFSPRTAPAMVWAGILTLLLVGASGYAAVRPSRAVEVFGIAVVAWICASAAALTAAVLLPPFFSLYDGWKHMCANRDQEAARVQHLAEMEEAARQRRAEEVAAAARMEAMKRDRPRHQTRAERLAEAKARYEQALFLLESAGLSEGELRAAKEKAKQDYLKEMDQVLS
jgi:hypothetical protein